MNKRKNGNEPIAVIAMAGRFPKAASLEALWSLVETGGSVFAPHPEGALRDAFTDAERSDENYIACRPLLDDIGMFDAAFFDMSPREAALTDPQHRVFLEICWEALESAGITKAKAKQRIGVFAGCSMPTYLMHNVLGDRARVEEFTSNYQTGCMPELLGALNDTLATRIAYRLDLKGPAFSVQSACSTSLLAVAQGCQQIRAGACDAALAGGVSITVPQERGYMHQEGGMASADGVCRPFDAAASGTVFSSGAGVVLLKRLTDAHKDGDEILAVIRGVGVNNDGHAKAGFTAPSVQGQADAIRMAHGDGDVKAGQIQYVECHGTATPLGDPIEFAGLQAAFGARGDEARPCALGSLKGTFGHMDAAAGVAGLIKTITAMRHGTIPPMPGYSAANPHITLAGSGFDIPQTSAAWAGNGTRLAGVSSFGVGGTNVHLVVEHTPTEPEKTRAAAPKGGLVHLPLSARETGALGEMRERLAAFLEQHPQVPLAEVAGMLQTGRQSFRKRSAVVASSTAEAIAQLRLSAPAAMDGAQVPPVFFMFPGQGAQYPGMAKALYDAHSIFAFWVDRGAKLCADELGCDLRDFLCCDPAQAGEDLAARMGQTQIAQPCLFITEVALAQLWIGRGLTPAAMIGHSVGEFAAATISGALAFEDGLRLVMKRGALMQAQPRGKMISARASATDLAPHLAKGAEISGINAPRLSVISGPEEAIEQTIQNLKAADIAQSALRTSHAFHSAMMEDVLPAMETLAAGISFGAGQIPFVSTATGDWLDDAQIAAPDYWAAQCRKPVVFMQALQRLCEGQMPLLIEVGPGRALSTFARQTLGPKGACAVLQCMPSGAEDGDPLALFEQAHGDCWANGCALEWPQMPHPSARKIALPTYPFQRKLHWIDAQPSQRRSGGAVMPEQPQATAPTLANGADQTAAPDRLSQIEATLFEILNGLSGMGLDREMRRVTFLELGFESLFIGQFAQRIEKQFAIKISFRDLLRDVPCIADLALRIEGETEASGPAPSAAPSQITPLPQATGAASAPRIRVPAAQRHGGGLTEAQQSFITKMVADYVARSPLSQAQADQNRPHLADPRTASGFSDLWKDMVFPVVCARSGGAYIHDIDGNSYIDLVNGFGQTAFGHAPDFVVEAVKAQLDLGFAIGPQTALAGEVAAMISQMTQTERVTFCNTGSEAVMAAMRVARTVTGNDRIVTFAQAYHGQFDEVLVKQGRSMAMPAAPGIPPASVSNMCVLPYGDPASIAWIAENQASIAGVIVEPVQSRHPDLRPKEFVQQLRALASEYEFALIFDEVVTGFRVHPGGMQAVWGIHADMATYGKVLGGGMPLGVLAGDRRFMDALDGGAWQFSDGSAPTVAPTFFAGTFVRHPLVLAATRAVLLHIQGAGAALYDRVAARTEQLVAEIQSDLAVRGIHGAVQGYRSWFACHFTAHDSLGALVFAQLRMRGVNIVEGYPCFLTTAHSEADFRAIAAAFRESVDALQGAGILAPRDAQTGLALPPPAAPLTPAQREIWLAAQAGDAASCAFNESVTLRLKGPLELGVLKTALAQTLARHDAVQVRFAPDGSRFERIENFELQLDQLDRTDAADPKEALAQAAAQDAHTPFDLLAGPCVRAQLLALAADDHALILTAHHIICDGWSLNILLDELAQFYRAGLAETAAELPPAQSFLSYASAVNAAPPPATLRFWETQLAAPPDLPDLPLDRDHSAQRSYAGGTRTGQITPEVTKALKSAGAGAGATLFSTCLTLLNVLIARLSRSADIVVAIPSAGQADLAGGALVGHLVNLLPIRAQMQLGGDFTAHVAQTQETVSNAYEHRDVTYGTLVEALKIPHAPQRLPLTEIQFNLERWGASDDFGAVQAQVSANPKAFANFDLFFNLTESAAGICLEVDYNADVLEAETVDRWIGHYVTLAEAAAQNPDAQIGALPIFDPGAYGWSAEAILPHAPAPALPPVHALFEARASATPEAIAVRHGGTALSYGALSARANRIARHIGAHVAGTGRPIAVLMERGADMPAVLLAIAAAGQQWVPLDPAHPPARIARILAAVQPACVICDSDRFDDIVPSGCAVLNLMGCAGQIAAQSAAPLQIAVESDAAAYTVFTSGSTGTPKGVTVPHGALSNLLRSMQDTPGCNSDDILLAVTTISFDIAALEMLLPLISGAQLVIADTKDVQDGFALAALARSSGATLIQATPTLWSMLLEAGIGDLPDCRFLCGGEVLPRDLAQALLPRCAALWNMYGPSETTIWSSLHRVEPGAGPVPIGAPIANTGLVVVDAAGMRAPPCVPGELWTCGAGLAQGYAKDEARSQQAFVMRDVGDGVRRRYFRTGDQAQRGLDGSLILFGRRDGQIKLRGFRIEIGDIEATLAAMPGLRHCAVALSEGPERDPRLLGFIVADDPSAPPQIDAIAQHCRQNLPDYMVPSLWRFGTALPLTGNGKLDRIALGKMGAQADHTAPARPASRPPEGSMEKRIAAIWEGALGQGDIGALDNIYALGGDSLVIFRIAAQMLNAGLGLDASDLMRNPTIAGLAQCRSDAKAQPAAAKRPLLSDYRRARSLQTSKAGS
ncbi:MAG: amino acid adenylation domain-containing protein [Sulfitobacter sp.]